MADAADLSRLLPGADVAPFASRLGAGPVYGFDVLLRGPGASLHDATGLTALVVSDAATATKVICLTSAINFNSLRVHMLFL